MSYQSTILFPLAILLYNENCEIARTLALLITEQRSESHPRERSLNVLNDLLKLMTERLGHSPTFEEFYPVQLELIVETVLGWKLLWKEGLGSSVNGAPIMGRCDFEQKTILVSSQPSVGARRYSLAHEIGHAFMHKDARSCIGGGLQRTRSVRSGLTSGPRPEEYAIEREAEHFAAELLMPAKAVRRYFQSVTGSPRVWSRSEWAEKIQPAGELTVQNVSVAIASYQPLEGKRLTAKFGVTEAAMATRIRELSLVF